MRPVTDWSVLVVPAIAKGRGSGHLKRCLSLVIALRELGRDAFLYLEPSLPEDLPRAVTAERFSIADELVFSGDPASRSWTFILIDRFRLSAAEFRRWAALAPLAGLDEGGRRRTSFDYLIDLLPPLPSVSPGNILSPSLLEAPRRRRAFPPSSDFSEERPLRVLVTFGGEDSAGLAVHAARSLAADPRVSVDLLRGALAAPIAPMDRVRVLDPVPDLKERLADYDLVATQFGLTAYEAARAGLPVLLASPTRYHEKLARAAGFPSVGVGKKAAARVGGRVGAFPELIERTAAVVAGAADPSLPSSLARLAAGIDFPARARCPLCGARAATASATLARFPDRTYRRCAECGLVYLVRTNAPPIVYARDYFFDDYKKQYGKTYLEDFPNLERAGRSRVRRMASLLAPRPAAAGPSLPPRILDIGCAYGPFLAAARSEGFTPYGLDPAADAVRFVAEELRIPAAAGLFPELDPREAFGVPDFDLIGMWYVIEHFTDLGAVLRRASDLLRVGGVFAFSTPSFGGISGRCRPLDFLERSPADHFSIWEPRRTAALLRRFGFRLAKIVVTGHHPERFPGLARARSDGAFYKKAMVASRLFGLGDTYEAYAVKERPPL